MFRSQEYDSNRVNRANFIMHARTREENQCCLKFIEQSCWNEVRDTNRTRIRGHRVSSSGIRSPLKGNPSRGGEKTSCTLKFLRRVTRCLSPLHLHFFRRFFWSFNYVSTLFFPFFPLKKIQRRFRKFLRAVFSFKTCN